MLDPWIIEEIRKREEERRRDRFEQPQLDVPRHIPTRPPEHEGRPPEDEKDGNRGVVIIDL
jgi:hypothetical protein